MITIRKATPADAQPILAILAGIAAEGKFTAISEPWPLDTQKGYLAGLSSRETVHVASVDGVLVGYQTLDMWAPTIASMSHVGQLGTFLAPDWRGRGVSYALFDATLDFARAVGYAKFVVQVRGANGRAQMFYESLGFKVCGRFNRQVRIAGEEDDEILLERFL
jgi:L-amino acid N-acyltransferase YncA